MAKKRFIFCFIFYGSVVRVALIDRKLEGGNQYAGHKGAQHAALPAASGISKHTRGSADEEERDRHRDHNHRVERGHDKHADQAGRIGGNKA